LALPIALALFGTTVQAQLVNLYTFAQTAGTYTAISGGTQILPPGADDDVSALANIGFTFVFNGASFTQFGVNANGHLRLGVAAASTSSPISSPQTNSVAAFARDGLSVGGVFYQLQGSAPNQVLVVEWPSFQPQWNGTSESMNMQIRLYEGTNVVQFVYGSSVRSVTRTGQVGLRGSSATTDFNNRTTTANWAATTAGSSSSSSMTFSTTAFPAVGQTYTWTPPVITDAAAGPVTQVTAACPGSSESLQARVSNSGTQAIDLTTNPISVSVAVTGAGSGTLTGSVNSGTLAVGATVQVPLTPSLDMSVAGTYNFATTVTMTGDAIAGNNTANSSIANSTLYTVPQTATFNTFTGSNLVTSDPGFSEGVGATVPAGTTSAWTSTATAQTTAFGSTAARLNLFGTARNEWIVMPKVTLGSNDRLTFRAAITDNASASADAAGGMAATVDDRVVVRISTNCGVSYTDLLTINSGNLLGITNNLTDVSVPLSAYAGQTVILAIYSSDGPVDDSPDYDFVIDNLSVNPTPACVSPLGFSATVTSTTSLSAQWNSEATAVGGYNWEVRSSGNPGDPSPDFSGNESGTSISVSGLTPNTSYSVYVQSDCDGDGVSTWVGPALVYTGYCLTSGSNSGRYVNNFSTTGGYTNISNLASGYSASGYGDFTAQSVSAEAGSSVNFSADYTGGTFYTGIWVDWNNDLDFNDANEQVFFQNTTFLSSQTGTISVPGATPNGDYRMRIRCNWTGTPAPCNNDGLGEAEDYTFSVVSPPACLPVTGFTASATGTTSLTASWTAEPNATNGYIWEVRTDQAPGDPGAVASGTEPGTSFSTSTGILPNTTYYVYVRSDCDGDGLSTWVGPATVFTGYCTPGVGGGSLDPGGLTRVIFSDVDNYTGPDNEPGGYADYSSFVGSVVPGEVVPVELTFETGYVYGVQIWVDWDNDLTFEAGESMYTGTTAADNVPEILNASITIPGAQAPGTYRMRIGSGDFDIPTNPCVVESYIAYEDYSLSICAPPVAVAEPQDDCMTQTYALRVTASSLGSGSSATIEYSVDGVPQAPVAYADPFTDLPSVAVYQTITATLVTDEGCSLDLGEHHSSCDIELDCGATTPIQQTHCYDTGDTRTWTFVNTEPGGTVAIKFLSGTMDGNDELRLWEGAPNSTAAATPIMTGTMSSYGTVTTTGSVLSLSITTDGSNDCATSGDQTSWVFQVRCGGCVEPVGYLAVDENVLGFPNVNCANGTFDAYMYVEDFGIDANTNLPPATVGYRLYVDNVGQTPVTGLDTDDFLDWYPVGTYALGTELSLELLHGGQSQCDVVVPGTYTVGYNACPPPNDACANATVLTVNTLANCPANAVTGTTRGADQSGGEPCGAGPVQDVWYAVDITGWATPRLNITDGTASVVGLELYNSCGVPQGYCTTDLTQFTYLNMNGLTPGVYYARVFTTEAGAGNFTICVSSPGVAGYECDGAINIPSVPVTDQAMVCTSEALPGLLNATTVPVAACGGASNNYKGGQEGLYSYTAIATGDYTISYSGVDYTGIFVYSGACPTNGGVCVGSNSVGFDVTTNSITVPMVMGELYYIWFDTWPTPNSPCPGTFSISEPVVPCTGVPDPGATEGPALACSGVPFTLSLENATSGTGVSYAWESSTDGGMNWDPIGGNTETLSASITASTMFRCTVTCATGPDSDTSDPITVGIETNPANCPCVPNMTQGCTDDDVIARVQLNTLDNNTGVTCPSGITGYNDYTGNPALTTTLQAGNSYNCTITVGPWSEGIAVWIDYDDNGVFDHPAERVGFTNGTISAGASLTFPIVVACNPPLGTHRMRVRARFSIDGSTILPCEDGSYGEVEDYLVTISAAVACPTPSGLAASNVGYDSADLTWNIGCAETEWELEYGLDGFALGSGTPVSVSGTPAHSLTSVLSPSTDYDVYVRADCDVDGFSTWFGPYSFSTGAVPPANDDCGGAIALTVNADYACGVVTSGTTLGATQSPQPDDATGTPNDDVWFSFVATNSTHRISLTNLVWLSGGTSSTDMGMAVFLGPCDDGGMIEVAESDPETLNMNGTLIPGQTYYVRVYSWSSTARNVSFDICVGTPPPPPANDDCAGAVALTVNTGLTCTAQTAGTVESATDSGVAVGTCFGTPDDDVWYTFVATQSEHIVSLNGVAGSTTSMNFQVFSDGCGVLTSIACGATGSSPSTTVSGLSVGQTYLVRVYTNTATGFQNTTFNICVTTPPIGPPANDECSGAIALTVNAGQTCTANTFGTVIGATASADATTCAGTEDDDVWFSFMATGPAHTVSLNSVAGSSTSMNFQVLSGSCGSLTSVVCSSTGTAPTAFASGLTAGNTYYVRVYTNTATGGQNTTFNVCVTSPPANDLCANAIAVGCNSVTAGTNVGASLTGAPGTCTVTQNTGVGVWYTVQGWGGPMVASLCGASFDTKIGIFTGSCGSLTCVTGNDDDQGTGGANVCGGGLASSTAWTSTMGTTYYIYVSSYSTTTGTFNLTVTCGSTAASCPANGLNLEFQNDANPGQVTWQVLNADGNATVLSGVDPIPANSIGTQAICLPDGCYRLRVLDSAGDGMTTGGYELRTSGMGQRIIDNTNNFSTGSVSAIASGGTFCLPLGTVTPIWSSCDKLDWVNNKFIVCHADAAVSAQYGVTNTTSGYEFWFFDPNGSYSYRRFRSHATSDGYGSGATRACHFKVNGWFNSPSTPQIPADILLNVRVRGRVAGVNQNFGPACQFMLDPALAACPRVKLQDDPANTSDYSCGVSRNFGGPSSPANRIYANPPQPIPVVPSSSVRYQFRFRITGENVCIVRPPQTSARMVLNWTTGTPLECNKTYEVDVRVSLDGGATWCFGPAGSSQAAACADTEDWGKVCLVTINPCAEAVGGGSSLATQGAEFTMYPNPNRGDQLFVSLSSVEEGVNTVNVDIYDLAGKRVAARTIAVQDGFVKTNLDLNGDLAGGMYMVNITAGDKTYTERLVIQP